MNLIDTTEVIGGKRYNTKTATLIADDLYWDGNNMERGGTNTWLFRTDKGNYFTRTQSQWQGSVDGINPLDSEEALDTWERLPEKYVDFETAFPHIVIEDA